MNIIKSFMFQSDNKYNVVTDMLVFLSEHKITREQIITIDHSSTLLVHEVFNGIIESSFSRYTILLVYETEIEEIK